MSWFLKTDGMLPGNEKPITGCDSKTVEKNLLKSDTASLTGSFFYGYIPLRPLFSGVRIHISQGFEALREKRKGVEFHEG